ncbi:pirin family protein [Magnetospirillum sp. UT-4]|uniref:pirin family protein n=1 Tax=Magnetospirillum sp. UT-4 TaxID=2681467 RepID=UPI001381DA2E|nr:pirin family protein [Magnetospirillum sp. UT-4]CAA7618553.1 putative Quercetin 2,3-dioxygenase [Magnetospirillum sp. UT-4]
MLDHRPFARLGTFENDWLNAHYHFSFADYFDPARLRVGQVRVWNDDTIRAGTGFAPHGHRDMEIVTYIRTGAISHEDSLGNQGRTEAGQVQVMSAGTGIRHAEFNREAVDTTLFQIWILPRAQGVAPRWETRPFPLAHGRLQLLASGHGEEGAALIHADARVLGATLDPGDRVRHRLDGRPAYLVTARGTLSVNGLDLGPRDGVAVEGETELTIAAGEDAEFVLVETA